MILDGERRWRAGRLAGVATLDVIVVDDPAERGTILERQLVANLQREDLKPLERARAIQRLLVETGWTAAKVACSIGISAASVSRALALLDLPEDIQKRVAADEIPASTAYAIAKAGDPELQSELADRVAQEKLTRDRVTEKVRGKPAGPKERPSKGRAAPRVMAALGRGRAVTLSGPGLDTLDQLIEWVEELLQRAKKARPRGVELSTFAALLRDEARAKDTAS